MRFTIAGLVLQRFERGMEQFVDDPFDGAFDGFAVLSGQVRLLGEQAVEFRLADAVPVLHQARDHIATRATMELRHEACLFRIDNLACRFDLA